MAEKVVEWYVVVTVGTDATGSPVEDARGEAADLLRYAAEQIEKVGFHGGIFATEDGGAEVEVHLAGDVGGSALVMSGPEGEA